MNKLFAYILSIIIGFGFVGCTQEPEWSYENTPQGNFEALWNYIDKKYCFVEEKDIDWDQIHEEYSAYIDTVDTERELFDVLADMLDKLQDGHVNLYSDFNVSRCRGWYKTCFGRVRQAERAQGAAGI